MHMMFVDESGDPGYPKDGNWKKWGGSRLYTRVGVIIHGHKWRGLNQALYYFKRNRGLSWDAEIKASDIRRRKGAFVAWDQNQRKLFLTDLLNLVGHNADITLIGVVIDKPLVDVSQRDRLVKPEIRSLELLLERYNRFLHGQKDRSGIVVMDPSEETKDDNLRHFESYLSVHSDNLRPLHIVESTFFAKSHTSSMVQVADICSNVFYRARSGAKGSRPEYLLIYPRFWKHKGSVQGRGIKKWPS